MTWYIPSLKALVFSVPRLTATTSAVLEQPFTFERLFTHVLHGLERLGATTGAVLFFFLVLNALVENPFTFERLVTHVLHCYLRCYLKDFHKHQLKIAIWNEQVFLENIELSLQAFDYLQLPLPFVLKQGRIAKIGIKIPWKKLGWDPCVISLENVFLCVSQIDDEEWSFNEVEKREFARKKTKLAAAELAKLSKPVYDNQAGFTSMVTAKVLDSIQLSIRDFHILYHDKLSGSACNVFGLKFSSLRSLKQNPYWSVAMGKGGQVNKTIMGLEFYCGKLDGAVELMTLNIGGDSIVSQNTSYDEKRYCNLILSPCDVSLSLSVNRELDGKNPQYSITAQIADLVTSLDDVMLQQILSLQDYLCTCGLRNRYGRYRPWSTPLSKKVKGWQKLWWHYAQESILSDVRKKLKKTSWRYFGQRLSSCRKYVNLYKTKLDLLRHDQPIDDNNRWELEQMEKELDIDDILSYRSAAECELQEFLVISSTRKSRGWLNWLSLDMLGAGGTDNFGQISRPVSVSDAVIKEASEFIPPILSNEDAPANDMTNICSLQFSINRISATLRNMKYGQEIAELMLNEVTIECQFREESAAIVAIVNSGEMIYPCNKKVILHLQRPNSEKNEPENENPSCRLQVDVSSNLEAEFSIKGMLQSLEVTIDAEFFLKFMGFLGAFKSTESQHARVSQSLNGIESVDGRLLSKAEYILSRHQKVVWDITIFNIVISVPWRDAISDSHNLVFEAGSLLFRTKSDLGSLTSDDEKQFYTLKNLTSVSTCNIFPCSQIQDLYDHYEVMLNDFELKVNMHFHSFPVSILEKLSASVSFAFCLIQDESILKQLEASVIVASLHAHFSPSIYAAVLGLIAYLGALQLQFEETIDSLNATSTGLGTPVFSFSTSMKLDSVKIEVELENEKENSSSVMLKFQQFDMCYSVSKIEECWISMNGVSITTCKLAGKSDCRILFSSGNQSYEVGVDNINDLFANNVGENEGCFTLQYESHPKETVLHKCLICFKNSDLYCYPYVTGLLVEFFDKLSTYGAKNTLSSSVDARYPKSVPGFGFQRFGFSNFVETGSSEYAGIPLDSFPFVMLSNAGSLGNLESSLLYASPEWKSYFSLRDSRIRSPPCSIKEVSKTIHAPALKSPSVVEASAMCGSSATSSLVVTDVSLRGMRVHFHDSKCIVGTITLPRSTASVSISANCSDILCSTEGLVLSSSWSSKNLREFLWGPSLSNLSPILNIRVKKECGPLSSRVELCFGIQHVYCILPPEYLAMIIGYFSLFDWSSDTESENECSFIYKIETLDSVLIVHVESNEGQFLKSELQQFYCTFIQSSLNNVLQDIPHECWVPSDKLAKRNHCLNFFGRDLFLSFLSFKDNQYSSFVDVPLIAPLSADVWVKIPCENQPSCESFPSNTCVMIRVEDCQLKPEDDHFLNGFEGLAGIINRFSIVSDLSECFKSDVQQFLQSKRCLAQKEAVPPVVSSINYTEVRCCINSLSILLNSVQRVPQDPFATAEMKFFCSASLRNDTLLSVALSFSSLELRSLPNSVVLARCKFTSSTSSVLEFSLTQEEHGVNELHVSLPSAEVWLYWSYWTEVIEMFKSYDGKFTTSLADNLEHDTNALIMRSEIISITFHFPVWIGDRAFGEYQGEECRGDGSTYDSIAVTLCSRSCELFVDGTNVKMKSDIEKLEGILAGQDGSVQSLPFFQLSRVLLVADINNPTELVHVAVDVQCDGLDIWISHSTLYFCHRVQFSVAERGPSQFSFGRIDVEVHLRKVSFLLTDGRWSCSGPLFQVLMGNSLLHVNATKNNLEGLASGELQVNYNNIHKIFWEPFVEPWQFEVNVIRKQEMSLSSSNLTDIHLKSTAHLNVNFTESFTECVFRTVEMIEDACVLVSPNDLPESQGLLNAPYVLQNMTSLPLVYHVYQGLDEIDVTDANKKFLQPGSSIPIYINGTPGKQLIHDKPEHFSERTFDQKGNGVRHHYITIQLDGTSVPSEPISMDLVGHTYFEVDFSMSYNDNIKNDKSHANAGFVVPVVFDVSVQRYSKLIRVYSTVILSNATSMALELQFDIPFGVSPEILGPIYPGQELPLPLHLAEAGRISWRPVGGSHLRSEFYNLSNLLYEEGKIGFLKHFVAYPVCSNDDPFRCCISVRNISLPSPVRSRQSSSMQTVSSGGQVLHKEEAKKQCIHQVVLSIPLVVNNYLPDAVTLRIESGGITQTLILSEVETSFHNVYPSHQLRLDIHIHGFKKATLVFPHREIFCKKAKCGGTKFSLSEVVTFDRESEDGQMFVTVEKVMDASSGARELFISVPFLLYNCTGFPLFISEYTSEIKGASCILQSCYDMAEQEVQGKKDGLGLGLVSSRGSHTIGGSSSSVHIVSRDNVTIHKNSSVRKPLYSEENLPEVSSKCNSDRENSLSSSSQNRSSSSSQLTAKDLNSSGCERGRVKACMFSPNPVSSEGEVMVRVRRCMPETVTETMANSLWSRSFSLTPPSGSATVHVPQPSSNQAFMMSITSNAVAAPFAGRTSAITFQPRYIISNACSKSLCYKQKGTGFSFQLGIGEHAHLHWMDTTRELLVSVCYNEPGWEWSGGFLPEHLGDTQVKMRNYLSGSLIMIRVEVQNADISVGDEKIVGNSHGNSGTNLILVSEDETGYMPYRVDNFSNERLRIYQQRCESFDTIVQSYTSCPYAWDEPCYPHCLIVEVPGKRVLGSYGLDYVKDHSPVQLPSSPEKPERTLHISIHVEGTTKVLRVIDSGYHVLNDTRSNSLSHLKDKGKHEQKQIGCVERISLSIPQIGFSLINIHHEELLFIHAKNITVDVVQSLDQQKLSFQMGSLQIDNQLRSTPYPAMLSFDREYKNNPAGYLIRDMEPGERHSFEPVIRLAVSKWRKKDDSMVSFDYLDVSVADFWLELEQELLLGVSSLIGNVSSRFHSRVMRSSDPFLHGCPNGAGSMDSYATDNQLNLISVPLFDEKLKQRLSLPSIDPIGAPWQPIFRLARRRKKFYVGALNVAPFKMTLSFSSTPMLRNGILAAGESVIHRVLMALADVEGAQFHLKQFTIAHQITSLESVQENFTRHYTWQLLQKMYKVFFSAGIMGNPRGFASSVGHGIKDFLSVPARSIFQGPAGLITGLAQGTTSLLSNTAYALSDSATKFTKSAHKGLVAVTEVQQQQTGIASHSRGGNTEVFEGLTGLYQSPINKAEKHGVPCVLSGIALCVAQPVASILEGAGKAAQRIRNQSRIYQTGHQRFRARLPRPLSRGYPLRPYCWEEAVGTSVLVDADGSLRLNDEFLVMCKKLKEAGKFIVITERLILIVSCTSLVDLGKPEFRGVPSDLEWVFESEIHLESVIHADCHEGLVHIIQLAKRSSGTRVLHWNNPTVPLIQTNIELQHKEDAENLLWVLLSTIELGKMQGWGCRTILHRSNENQRYRLGESCIGSLRGDPES